MKSRVEGIKSIFIKKTDTTQLVKILEDATKKIENFKKLLRNKDFVSVNLVSIPTEAGYQECMKTCSFLKKQGFEVNNILVNNIIPNFDEETWKVATQNKAVALLKSEKNNQQPYVQAYHQFTNKEDINLIGVSKLPFEPRGERLIEFSKFLSKLDFDAELCQEWVDGEDANTLRLRFPHSGEVKLKKNSYTIGSQEYFFKIPNELKDKKIRKQKTKQGATYTFK